MENKVFSQVVISVNNSVRKAAFAKGINRDVNFANVKKILADMRLKGYRKAEVIQVIPAENAIKNGDVTLVDINQNPIKPNDAANYYLVLEGQHRVYAVSDYNTEIEKGELQGDKIEVPALHVELNNETISEYISAINITKFGWKIPEYVKGAANVAATNPLLIRYNELIKSPQNRNGISLSTLNLIFFGNAKALTQPDLSLICQGHTTKGTTKKRNIITRYSIEKGNKFIDMCLNAGFLLRDIKRYVAEEYVSLKINVSEEHANKVFSSITPNDREAMYNKLGNLDETLVKAQIEIISQRISEAEKEESVITESHSEEPSQPEAETSTVSNSTQREASSSIFTDSQSAPISEETDANYESESFDETGDEPLRQAV